MLELKACVKKGGKEGVHVTLTDDADITAWTVLLSGFPEGSPLAGDLATIKAVKAAEAYKATDDEMTQIPRLGSGMQGVDTNVTAEGADSGPKDGRCREEADVGAAGLEATEDSEAEAAVEECGVQLALQLPPDYPQSPPFIRVLRPRMVVRSGHITAAGSICEESLTHGGWSSTTQLLELLIRIKMLLVDGGARVDLQASGGSYGELEAREAYFRVARDHGWVT